VREFGATDLEDAAMRTQLGMSAIGLVLTCQAAWAQPAVDPKAKPDKKFDLKTLYVIHADPKPKGSGAVKAITPETRVSARQSVYRAEYDAHSLTESQFYKYAKQMEYAGGVGTQLSPFHQQQFRPTFLNQTNRDYDRTIAQRGLWESYLPKQPPLSIHGDEDRDVVRDYDSFYVSQFRPSPLAQTSHWYDDTIGNRFRYQGLKPMYAPVHYYSNSDNLPGFQSYDPKLTRDYRTWFYSGEAGKFSNSGSYFPSVKRPIYSGY